MPFERIVAIVAAYTVISVLLLSLNIASRWRWWVKAGATIVCGFFFVVSYVAIASLLGWPSAARVPDRFSLIATRVVEPNRALGEPGAIYLWIETLDADNISSGQPLSYQILYTDDLARTVGDAQTLLDQGQEVEASLQEVDDLAEGDATDAGPLVGGGAAPVGGASDSSADDYMPSVSLKFNNLPPVRLPDKGAL